MLQAYIWICMSALLPCFIYLYYNAEPIILGYPPPHIILEQITVLNLVWMCLTSFSSISLPPLFPNQNALQICFLCSVLNKRNNLFYVNIITIDFFCCCALVASCCAWKQTTKHILCVSLHLQSRYLFHHLFTRWIYI